MALFAMLAILTSPALALACCCGEEVAPVQAPYTSVFSTQAPKSSHPDCHGHAAQEESEVSDVSASGQDQAAPVAVSTSSQRPFFQSLCDCSHGAANSLTFVAEQHSSFSPLILGVAVQAFSPSSHLPASVRLAFASNAAKPRSPASTRRLGRAPPALSPELKA